MLEQIHFKGRLELLSPLHAGTGEFTPLGEIGVIDQEKLPAAASADEAPPEQLVARVARDDKGLPCIPVASLKGCLLSACRQAVIDSGQLAELFGEISDHTDESGRMGRLLLGLARADEQSIEDIGQPDLPHYDAARASYLLPRVSIDRDRGTAKEHHLFMQELVPAGVRFCFSGIYLGCVDDFKEEALPVLAVLVRPEGVSLGKGQGLGQGRLRLEPESLKAERIYFDPWKFCKERHPLEVKLVPAADAAGQTYQLTLKCEGPFLITDPSRAGKKGDAQDPAIKALQEAEGKPLLLPSSLLGVLRSKMAWRQALKSDVGIDEATQIDDPDRKPSSWADPGELTVTERLFGVTGWRKLLKVKAIELKGKPQTVQITSVALDRFTQGPIDGALFTTEAYLGVEYQIVLELESRGGRGAKNEDDKAAWEDLLEYLEEDGLVLGHGGAKGFGWFEVTREGGDHGRA